MIRILTILLLSCNFAVAQISQQTIVDEITANLPTNNRNEISAELLRNTLNEMTSAIFQNQGLNGLTLTGTPTVGQTIIATSSTTASWQSIGGLVTSVTNADGSLIINPITGLVVGSLNTNHSNTWTQIQNFSVGGTSLTLNSTDSSTNIATTAFVKTALTNGFSGVINVQNPPFNAKCDGTTDDTVAIQNAMSNSAGLFIPDGACVVSNLVATQNTRISGNGPTSVLKFKTGSTGYMIEATTSFSIQVDNLTLNGGNVQDYQGVSSPGTRSGIHLWANVDNSMITNSVITGFNNVAVGLNGDQNAVNNGTAVIGNKISQNYCGVDTGPSGTNNDTCTGGANGAEYLKIAANSFVNNRYAVVVDSGNVDVIGNDIAHNGNTLYVNGAPTPNPAHGSFIGNLANHALVNAVTLQSGIGTGFIISNNQFFGGNWVLTSPDGITIANNTIATPSISISGAGYINWDNNWFTQNIPVITGSPTNTHWNCNYSQPSQDYFQNTCALLVDPKGTTAKSVSQTLGSNVVTDGTFTVDPGPWTKGTGWTINTGTNSAHSDGTGFASFLKQAIGAAANQYWQVTFTIANYVSGNVVIGIGGAVANFPAFANGTYTFIVPTAPNAIDGNLYFVGNGLIGDIQNVSALKWATYGTVKTTYQQSTPITVAELEACNAANEGTRAYVTDQNTAVAYRGAVTGSGSTRQAVLCSNTAWIQD